MLVAEAEQIEDGKTVFDKETALSNPTTAPLCVSCFLSNHSTEFIIASPSTSRAPPIGGCPKTDPGQDS